MTNRGGFAPQGKISEYLRSVKRGEELIVTERGKPVARISPAALADGDEGRRLQALEKAGIVRRGAGGLPRGFWKLPRPRDSRGLVRKRCSKIGKKADEVLGRIRDRPIVLLRAFQRRLPLARVL